MTRTRTVRLAARAAATVAVTALALTACGSGGGSRSAGQDTEAAAGTADEPATDEGDEGGDAKAEDKGDACTPAEVRVQAKPATAHAGQLLVVATNTAKKPCRAYGYPFVRFDQDQASGVALDASRPRDTVTLTPGASAYAAVAPAAADGKGANPRKAKRLAVSFQAPSGGGSAGDPADVPLPGGELTVDDSARTTYWQKGERDALKW
ncbi:DUF4232 domain-containing protein [Streptomyces gamaensis]|uniref:DUF4232 domain-containing protein n=1 Tax=Streptomyces gamaensis TaxID=1763542 RepID=A0ABW0YU08_9ACTN